MCLAILRADPRYSDVRPRRPKGGPDGARDIEAVIDDIDVWGAVGFRNNARDSDEDLRWVKEKFISDWNSAKNENPNLRAFVFFTNVDLTPAQLRNLEEAAVGSGADIVEIYYRERIRIALDSPTGFAIRYQYLSIPMSDAEQATFFTQWGDDIERLITDRFSVVHEMLQRVEFLHDSDKALHSVGVRCRLDGEYGAHELGAFRFMLVISDAEINVARRFHPRREKRLQALDPQRRTPRVPINIAAVDITGPGGRRGVSEYIWSDRFDPRGGQRLLFERTSQIRVFGPLRLSDSSYRTLADLDGRYVSLAMTPALFEKLEGIELIANDYAVLRLAKWELVRHPGPETKFAWPQELGGHAPPWETVLLRASVLEVATEPDDCTYLQIDFEETPMKLRGRVGAVQIFKPPFR